ncbi:inner membrane CreD family protein [Desulfosarcina sp. OttesenSCG-928-G10]|nr:inner membrane CreD family protein [Desulfosarcina sp. OttesenSCG-928-G10]MDL2321951.1 inner membrane CreD family protein [Desulfosarcina sp. OttesenSCG-928-B08]
MFPVFQTGNLGEGDFSDKTNAILDFTAGVQLFETVSLYTQAKRAVKYGILFIGLTFVALFSFELLIKKRLHLLQYGMVGLSLTLFYLVLLSLAEHISFMAAFVIASLLIMVMNGLYIRAALHSPAKGLIIALLLGALYLVLYTLLQMEDYALLIGTIMVVAAMGSLMFLTRNLPMQPVDAEEKPDPESSPHNGKNPVGIPRSAGR